MDANGNPNPRITCTAGYDHAFNYVQSQMQQIGLTPLGDVNRTTYAQLVPGSVDATWCPPGIKNLVGMVPGTQLPNEYVIYSAHLDGPKNENPQTDVTRMNDDVSNAYDDGFAVAVGLALAKQLMANPPSRSVLFVFDDGEEGWWNVGQRQEGEEMACSRFVNTEWYRNTYDLTGGNSRLRSDCQDYLIGASYW